MLYRFKCLVFTKNYETSQETRESVSYAGKIETVPKRAQTLDFLYKDLNQLC